MIICKCKNQLNAQMAVGDDEAQPKPGDLTVCAYCGALYQFDANMTPQPVAAFREFTFRILAPDVMRNIDLVREAIKEFNKKSNLHGKDTNSN